MFVIVRLSEDTVRGRRKRKEPFCTSERTDIDLHRYFFTVTVKTRNGKYNRKALEGYTGRLSSSLILPDTPLKENRRLSLRRLLNFSPVFFKDTKPVKRLCICDPEGFGADLAEKLLPYASALHIISSRKELWQKTAQELFNKYGAAVTVSQLWNENAEISDSVISSRLDYVPLSFRGDIFTCDTSGTHPSTVCRAQGIELPFRFERLRPTCTDKLLFATCLYEKCSVTEIERCPFENIDICRR